MSESIENLLRQVIEKENSIAGLTMCSENLPKIASSYVFINDLEKWIGVIKKRNESEIYKMAIKEYEYSIIALVNGHYRNAFKGIRLVLELICQGILLSANELLLREWLQNRGDTVWAQIKDSDNGIFSKRFAKAFCPDLEGMVMPYISIIETLYRECSECVHGNVPKEIILPSQLSFDQTVFDLWIEKTGSLAFVCNCGLAIRYINDFSTEEIRSINDIIDSRLSHIEYFRAKQIS